MEGGLIEVEVKVIGMFGADFVSVAKKLPLKPGAKVKDALARLYKEGAIDKKVYKQIRKPRPPCYLVLNDEKAEGKAVSLPLRNGDTVAVMQLMAGG